MSKHLKILWIVTSILTTSSCVNLRSVSLTQIPKKRSKVVRAIASKFIILGLTFDNDFVEKINTDLIAKCSNGRVQGILTEHHNTIYFPVFLHKVTVEAKGFCVKD